MMSNSRAWESYTTDPVGAQDCEYCSRSAYTVLKIHGWIKRTGIRNVAGYKGLSLRTCHQRHPTHVGTKASIELYYSNTLDHNWKGISHCLNPTDYLFCWLIPNYSPLHLQSLEILRIPPRLSHRCIDQLQLPIAL